MAATNKQTGPRALFTKDCGPFLLSNAIGLAT